MSRETLTHLNTQTLIGFTDKRGHAWHYRAEEQGEESNHYPGAVPVADVERRLFDWLAEPRPLFVQVPASMEDATGMDEHGNPVRMVAVPDRQGITHSRTGKVFGVFSNGYAVHQFGRWLLEGVSPLISDTLSIGSAGVLRDGALAWVSVEVPESHLTPEGVEYRANLLAATSHDGSLATTYKRVATNVVCDNTMSAALREHGQAYKVRHSRYSTMRLQAARDALALLELTADDFAAEVKALCQRRVTDAQWRTFTDRLVPMPEGPGRARTMAEKKRETLSRLWNHDHRVSPWKGTGWGVMQAVNTYVHHEQTVRGAERAERNMLRAVTGGIDDLDRKTADILAGVLAA